MWEWKNNEDKEIKRLGKELNSPTSNNVLKGFTNKNNEESENDSKMRNHKKVDFLLKDKNHSAKLVP